MSNNYIVITKPLQFFNSINIPLDEEDAVFLLVNNFNGAAEFYHKLLTSTKLKCLFFQRSKDPYNWLIKNASNGDKLYINSDYGVQQTIWLFSLRKLSIFVYEEGIGTYRMDLNQRPFPIRSMLSSLGFKSYFGGGWFTKGIYVYDVNKYLKSKNKYNKKVYSFKKNFIEHLEIFEYKDLLYTSKIDFENISQHEVIIYLSSWIVDKRAIEVVKSHSKSLKILKLHPHIKDNEEFHYNQFDIILNSSDMIEFVIYDILKFAKKVTVIHHNSSALEYFRANDKIYEILI